ncbi:hypothetical protein MATL_G00179380 [Megalops atlanticus]|uniref:E3 ubiquitin-protein ligase TRIM32 n=1 Tax=Megalops atlanticus TaxID=7932 RepID=A0A9D3SZV6_MEGAT|nr:hypothetical protein MATL_G00179380 [Megalops atlanticus]
MMFVGSQPNNKAPLRETLSCPLPGKSGPGQADGDAREEPSPGPAPSPAPPGPLPCWATAALCELARGERELRALRERQAGEAEAVSRGLERAVLGARREERRLLERVEQDHRDAQRRLEQLQRENAAAARVGQALVDQRLRQVAQLREEIQRWGGGDGGEAEQQRRLQQAVAELTRPWEITLSLKRVSFRPSSQPKPITFGEIRVREHNLTFPVAACSGPQGRQCSLHSLEARGGDGDGRDEGRSTPDGVGGAAQGQASTLNAGGVCGRVVRKIRLSPGREEEQGEEVKLISPRVRRWPPLQDASDRESSQEEELESLNSDSRGEDVFQAVPAFLSNGESEGEELGDETQYALRGQRKPASGRTTALQPGRKSSASPVGGRLELDSQRWRPNRSDRDRGGARQNQDSTGGISRYNHGILASPKNSPREPFTSYRDLSPRDRPHSRLSLSSDEHPLGTPGEAGRAPSPTDSLDSCYTFIVSSPRDYSNSLARDTRLSRSTADLSRRNPPLIDGGKRERQGVWRVNRSRLASASPILGRGPRGSGAGRTLSCEGHRENAAGGEGRVCRSLSMSVIEVPLSSVPKQEGRGPRSSRAPQEGEGGRGERAPSTLMEEDEGEPHPPEEGRLVRQFGKQGSGRAEFTLPSGVHATPQGQLFVVDSGNARLQVTDARGNILQQVTSATTEGSARRCRNYFDIAVNAKGLIALSCAAERALLVFNRHGRPLQTFGGPGGGARDELEAPRGVTVTHLDEFLVADIRRGTLTALKLDPKTGSKLERTVVPGFHRPYLVAASPTTGLVAVSERGSETGREPCVKVLEPGWSTIRILGVCSGMGPLLSCPWGICIDRDGDVLVADWAEEHRVVMYPARGQGRPVITQGLSSPRGLTLLPEGHLVVSDSMHHCIKIFRYK